MNEMYLRSHVETRFTILLLASVLLAACNRGTTPEQAAKADAAGKPPATSASASDPAEVTAEAAPASAPTISVSTGSSFDSDFTGQALDYMKRRALPATEDLKQAVATRVRENKGLGDCHPSTDRNQVHLIDLDSDGDQEGLAVYTLENCGGPQYATRVLAILRQDEQRTWIPVSETAISVRADSKRAIISIDDGTVMLAGEDDGFGGMTEPEGIAVPAKPERLEEAR